MHDTVLSSGRYIVFTSISFLISFLFRDILVEVWNYHFKIDEKTSFKKRVTFQVLLVFVLCVLLIIVNKYWKT